MIFTPEMCDFILRDLKTSTIRRADKDTAQRLKVGDIIAVCPGRGKKAIAYLRVTRIREIPRGCLLDLTTAQIQADGFSGYNALYDALTRLHQCSPDLWAWKLIEFKRVEEEVKQMELTPLTDDELGVLPHDLVVLYDTATGKAFAKLLEGDRLKDANDD